MKSIIKGTLAGLVLATTLSATETIATVNGVKITQEDLQGYLKQMPQNARAQAGKLNKKALQEQLVQRELLTQYALENGIKEDEHYQEMLRKLKRDLALELWMKKQMDGIEVTEAQMKEYYKENEDRFQQMASDQIRARHILVEDKAKAQELIEQLQGADNLQEAFIAAAKKHSTGPSGKNGGDLGFFGKGRMVPEFDKVVFDMNVGDMTKKPVKTKFGYHVIYVEDKKDRYEVLKPMIERNLKLPKFSKILQETTEKAKQNAQITYN